MKNPRVLLVCVYAYVAVDLCCLFITIFENKWGNNR